MPPYIGYHTEIVYISGVFEILGAIGILTAFGAEQFPNEARSTGLGLGYGIGATANFG